MAEATDAEFAEPVLVEPGTRSDYGGFAADPGRLAFEVGAVVNDHRGQSADIGGMQARIAYEEAEMKIRLVAMPNGAEIRKNDRVTRTTETGQPRYLVMRADPPRHGRRRYALSRIEDE